MELLIRFWRELTHFLRRDRFQQDLAEEMREHLEEKVAELAASGMPAEEARLEAQRQFGNALFLREKSGDAWGFQWLETLLQDLRFGLRQLRRNPGFTAVAIITLALGIGATTAIFSVVNGVLLKPLPYPHPKQLVALWLTAPGMNIKDLNPSPAIYFVFRDQNRAFQDLGLYMGVSRNVTGNGEPERVEGLDVTYGFLPTLGVRPLLGRSFTRADDAPGSAATVMLTYGYWWRKFGGDRTVIGKTITVDGKQRLIIGVLPQKFQFGGSDLALLIPLQMDRAKQFLGGFAWYGIARLKPEVTLAQADADVARMLPIYLRSFSAPPGYTTRMFEDARIGPNLRPLKQDVVGDVGNVLWVLMGGIGLVLVIA
ncbi:MAG TPA: ABC transporter permease, partial [Terriglobia bacterium]|nr:ABC transporter permease [Terriglobia bacterium]